MSEPELEYPLLDRQGGIDLVAREFGVRISKSKLERDLIDRPDQAPQPVRRYGRRLLYEASAWRRYAERVIKKIEPGYFKAGPGRPRKAAR
jgi:hypothetical protein